ncbi:hypothetical protein TNIN_297061 [Trichonephila inaurata madagascariensis]|uniref:Uncharacterized protein n=1 Tax=Trichonephila inaurata madagascariensis TaxID=2747483 RepID=A0A8X7CN72_9ARAC|nr:hypothetical protein TNIN_297061 [Trichonephila inaurata madagascariensis]
MIPGIMRYLLPTSRDAGGLRYATVPRYTSTSFQCEYFGLINGIRNKFAMNHKELRSQSDIYLIQPKNNSSPDKLIFLETAACRNKEWTIAACVEETLINE